MIEARFCNYNIDYQQRLGFLKVVCRVGQGARGGPDDILDRVKSLYPEFRRPSLAGRAAAEEFNPKELIRRDEVPSWIVGFVPKRLDRLVLWAEMVGLLAQSGRLSEWATILDGLRPDAEESSWRRDNPFVLSLEERALFMQLLFYHDQVLPILVTLLGKLDAGTRIGVAESCILVLRSLGGMLDRTKGNSPDELQLRHELRDLLERIGRQYNLSDPRALANASARRDVIKSLTPEKLRGLRTRLVEYHAICRFEQLVDLGLLTKQNPQAPSDSEEAKEKARTSWAWYTCPGLRAAARILEPRLENLESFFQEEWIEFCGLGLGHRTRALDTFEDQMTIATLLDKTLPRARRRLGPVQLHSWGSLACLQAFAKGELLELNSVTRLLEAMRADSRTSNAVRLSGRAELRGRTASVPKTGLAELLQDYRVHEGEKYEQE